VKGTEYARLFRRRVKRSVERLPGGALEQEVRSCLVRRAAGIAGRRGDEARFVAGSVQVGGAGTGL
jgi:hypothetical protein